MEKPVIHKVIITAEAQFDYENIVVGVVMPKTAIKSEIEEYIANRWANGLLKYGCGYLRIKYLDEPSNHMLMIFLYRGSAFATVQSWLIKGVCLFEDWNEDLEYDGQISAWLKSPLDTPNTRDWVWALKAELRKQKKELDDEGEKFSYMVEVKDLLKNYRKNKMLIKVGDQRRENIAELIDKIDCLDTCISMLDEISREFIQKKYIEGISLRELERQSQIPKSTIQRKITQSIEMIEICFSEKYDS